MRLRYIGTSPTTFISLGVSVEPGEEFDAPDAIAAGYTSRADVEAVESPKAARGKPAKKAAAPDPAVPSPSGPVPALAATPEEAPGDVPDDH